MHMYVLILLILKAVTLLYIIPLKRYGKFVNQDRYWSAN